MKKWSTVEGLLVSNVGTYKWKVTLISLYSGDVVKYSN